MDSASPLLVAVLGIGVAEPDDAVLAADDLGLTRGDGCFDATRIATDDTGRSEIDHLDAHLERFARSAAALDLSVDADAWRPLIAEAVGAWTTPGEAVLKMLLTRGRESRPGEPAGLVTIAPLGDAVDAARRGIAVATMSRGHRLGDTADCPWLLPGVKSLSYGVNVAAGREAARRGADDALFVTSDGWALEAPRAALVWRTGQRLATTRLADTGVLRSITQRAVFAGARAAGFDVAEDLIAADDLPATDGAWLVSSGRLVAPILSLDGRALPHDDSWSERVAAWSIRPFDLDDE